jgi:integrase/recombinase XerD
MKTKTIGPIIYSFFEDYLKCQKGLRPASVRSYRDTLRLFLNFVARDTHRKLTRLTLPDLTAERVRRFLNSLEEDRYNHIRSRNQRLSALRTFFEYLANQRPEVLAQAEQVASIPTKRVPPPETFYLEKDEVNTLFARLPTKGRFALRDRTLLLFLYNTGARVQEVADLRVSNLEFEPQRRVHLHGKGDKWRICPLWQETASLLKQLLYQSKTGSTPERPVFMSRSGRALTRYGIYKIVRRHTQHLGNQNSNARRPKVSPHVFRHTTAVHLLEAGVDVNVIRAWLGHVNLETTNRYAEINIRMKEEALSHCQPPFIESERFLGKKIWRDDPALLEWLQSL